MPPSSDVHPDPHLTEMFRSIRRDARSGDSSTPTAVIAGPNYVIDGGGVAITTGSKGGVIFPFPCRIKKVELQEMDGISGTITIDIQKSVTGPTPIFTSIVGATPPKIATLGRYYFDESWAPTNGLADWTTLINRGDALRFVVTAASTIQRITVALHVQRLDITA